MPLTGGFGAWQRRWRWLAAVVVLMLIGASVWLLGGGAPLDEWLLSLKAWIEPMGLLGALYLMAVITVWSIFLPPAPLQFLAAAIYGLVAGIGIFYLASTVTLVVVVAAMRGFGQGIVERQLARWPKLRVVEQALVHHGWRSVMLLRLSGAIPSTLANPVLGASRLPLFTIMWASWVGKFPGILLMGLLGAASGQWAARDQGPSTGTWILFSVAVVASLTLIVLISRTARRLWREELAAESEPVTPTIA